MDAYAAAAQYSDLLYAERSAARVRALLDAVGAEVARGILDLGAGTGAVLAEVARAYPQAPIVAVEPSVGMRTALYTRLAADEGLRARTTVLPETAERLALAGVADLALCLDTGALFPPAYRPDIWAALHAALAPGGLLLLDEPPLAEPEPRPAREVGRVTVGAFTIVGTVRGEPAGQRQWWENRYQVFDAEGEVVADDLNEYYTWPVAAEEVCAELGEAGFVLKDIVEIDGTRVIQARR